MRLMKGEQKLFHPFCLGNKVCDIYILNACMCNPPAAFPSGQGAEPWKITSLESMSSQDNSVNSHAQFILYRSIYSILR